MIYLAVLLCLCFVLFCKAFHSIPETLQFLCLHLAARTLVTKNNEKKEKQPFICPGQAYSNSEIPST